MGQHNRVVVKLTNYSTLPPPLNGANSPVRFGPPGPHPTRPFGTTGDHTWSAVLVEFFRPHWDLAVPKPMVGLRSLPVSRFQFSPPTHYSTILSGALCSLEYVLYVQYVSA